MTVEVERQQQEQAAQGHMDHMMKGGFTMNDLKGLHRFGEENAEADEGMLLNPSRPQRKGSISRGSPIQFDMMSPMGRSTSAMDIDFSLDDPEDKDKKRGRSPFKFFSKKSRDQSKDKHKSKSPTDRSRGRGTCMPNKTTPFHFHTFTLLIKFPLFLFVFLFFIQRSVEVHHLKCIIVLQLFAFQM